MFVVDGFVLSSSEFGDAYLAQGWAREFVREVLNRFTAVFIGYSADDPPIRYLLEGLQESNGIQNNIYAFQCADEEAVAQWAEKGVKSIVFESNDRGTYDALWDTLSAWGKRTKNPTKNIFIKLTIENLEKSKKVKCKFLSALL